VSNTTFHGELVIGLIYAVGTRTNTTITSLEQYLNNAGYTVVVVKVSKDVIPRIVEVEPEQDDEYSRISALMDAGNRARKHGSDKEDAEENSRILGYGVAATINTKRTNSEPNQKTAYIVDSLKHPSEIDTLKTIYSDGFVTIGLHSTLDRRKAFLTNDKTITSDNADDLIRRDADESGNEFGQHVTKTFHLADFFLNVGSNEDLLRCDINRMVDLWFGCPFHTPTFDEYAMFMAFSAALRSADLSRQVGSVIAQNNEIISTGANDCPRSGGGLYWPERKGDYISDAELGRDHG